MLDYYSILWYTLVTNKKGVYIMNLHELFEKFETEFLACHEKIKTGLDLYI